MSFTTYRIPHIIRSDESSDSCDSFDITSGIINNSRNSNMSDNDLREALEAIRLQNQELLDRLQRLESGAARQSETANQNENAHVDDSNIPDDESSESVRNITNLRLRDELHLITDFDGKNISVETFIWEIKQVLKDFEGRHKQRLLRLILTQKVIKEARTAIDGIEIHEAEDLFAILRNEFGTVKSYDLMSLERTQCYQGHETVNEYSKRFIRTHRDVKRSLANDTSIPAEDRKILFANEDKIALPQYMRGLDPRLRIRIQGMRPKNINEAQDFAMELEREDLMTREIDRRYGRGGNSRRNVVMGLTPSSNRAITRGEQRESRVVATGMNNARSEQYELRTPRYETRGTNNVCYNCGSNRHFARECPKPRALNRDFYARPHPPVPPGQIKYTASPQSEMNSQPCTSDWKIDFAEDSSQTPAQP